MDPCLKKLEQEIVSVIAGMPSERWHLRPPGKWSAAEVLEHLYLSYAGTIRGFERAATSGRPLATRASWAQRAQVLIVVGFGYMPSGRQAPAVARPRGLPTEKVLAEIVGKIAEMDECIRRVEEKFGTSTKLLDHPMLGPLTGPEWRKLHLVHGRHHARQIRRLGRTVKAST